MPLFFLLLQHLEELPLLKAKNELEKKRKLSDAEVDALTEWSKAMMVVPNRIHNFTKLNDQMERHPIPLIVRTKCSSYSL